MSNKWGAFQLTLEKKFSGDELFAEDTRPEQLYFKLLQNGVPFTDYTGLMVTVKVGDDDHAPADGLITVSRKDDLSYPQISVYDLPIGVNARGGVQTNGESAAYNYSFAECDQAGNILDGSETFPYNWDGAKAGTAVSDNGQYSGNHTVRLDNAGFTSDYEITNTLKTEDHTVKKKWNDDANNGIPDYYKTRPDTFKVRLDRTTDEAPTKNSAWETVRDNIVLPSDKSHLSYENYTQNNEIFQDLPQYDKDGKKYYYRVVETYIGDNEVGSYQYQLNETTIFNDATYNYYVTYDDSYSDTQTLIDNSLVRKTDYLNLNAKKIWEDNLNQDGKREPVTVVLVQSYTDSDSDPTIHSNEFEVVLNEENNWFYNWKNYPLFTPNGRLYEYSIVEKTVVDGYSRGQTQVQSEANTDNSYIEADFTNTHSQSFRSLTADKSWEGDESFKSLRPESIEYVLCCRYTAYKYVYEEGGVQTDLTTMEEKNEAYEAGKTLKIVEDTSRSYDGPVSGAEVLRSYYTFPDSYKFTRTVSPSDKTVDEQWNGVTFEALPVYINTCADERWSGREYAVEYYVMENEPEAVTENPYTYGVDGFKSGASEKTALLSGSSEENKVVAKNELKTRSITVTKVWEDNGYGDSLHYDIDITLSGSGEDDFSYSETRTLETTDTSKTVTFAELPMYDKAGNVIQYCVAEKAHSSQDTHRSGYYISAVTAEPAASITKNDTAYTVSPAADNTVVITGYTITNTLPVVHYKADKIWDDNSNRDGKRPAQLGFTLSGEAEGHKDIDITLNDASVNYDPSKPEHRSGDRWSVDFGVQPEYNANNVRYNYSAAEGEAEGYSSEQLPTDFVTENGITVNTFHFRNVYTPEKDSLQINKSWAGDSEFSSWTRPANVRVRLCYSIDGGNTVDLSAAGDDDPVKKLLRSYGYTDDKLIKNINGEISGNTWTTVFEDLPRYVNPTGTPVFNGQSEAITYSVEEVKAVELNGYTTEYSSPTALNGTDAVDTLTVTNTLRTKTIEVEKVWNDNGYTSGQELHYDVNITLDNTDGLYTKQEAITKDSDSKASFVVPEYLSDGTPAEYTVTESGQRYGYVTSYSDNHSFSGADIENGAVITVTNSLPLTEVSVQKEWEDYNNKYSLRPESISVTLQRRPVGSSEWSDCGTAVVTGTSWAHTFDKLPKFNEDNVQYEYQAIEASVNAYDTSYLGSGTAYQSDPVIVQDTNTGTDSSLSFGIKNTLIEAPVKLVKVWDDNGCTQSGLHYPVTFSIADTNTEKITFTGISVQLTEDDKDNASSGSETWIKNTAALPVYYKDGTPIRYIVTEEPTVGTNAQFYGYRASKTDVTQNGTYPGYTDNNYYDTYTITNVLPVTSVRAVKQWAGDLEKYPNSLAEVNVVLTRSSNGTADTAFRSEQQIPYTTGEVGFTGLLVKDHDGNDYTYTITEQAVRGYDPAYENQSALAAEGSQQVVTITNTPKKGKAELYKYDATDYEKYNSESDFVLKTIPNAEFELHRVLNDNDKLIYVTGSDGSYRAVPEDTSGAERYIVSGTDGRIMIDGLEPNDYYLTEVTAPTGYREDKTTKYYFSFDVSESNAESIVFRDNIEYVTKNADENEKVHGIPNMENMSRLTLKKLDSVDKTTPLPNAHYDLLRLVNFEYRAANAAGSTEEEYLENALRELNEDFNADSSLYWEMVGSYTTDTTGMIHIKGYMFGTYVFYEVKPPVGYERDYNYAAEAVTSDAEFLGPVTFDDDNAEHDQVVYNLTHYEPRRDAKVNILKTNEDGDPLRGAEFKLFKEGDDTAVGTVTTGYSGMGTAITLDTDVYDWGTEFYFIETKAPTGYFADNGLSEQNRIRFTLTRELADEEMHVVRADNARLKGKVTLTKLSGQATTQLPAGTPLSNAGFRLYSNDGTPLDVYAHSTDSSHYFAYSGNDTAVVTAAGFDAAPASEMTTGTDGRLYIENLDWGSYYLEETAAPAGFVKPDGEAARVYFSVGRNNCGDTPQQLTMKNDPITALLSVTKHIDKMNAQAWGTPAFIFRLRQTAAYNYADDTLTPIAEENQPVLTKTVTVGTAAAEGYEDSTGAFEVEPGTYIITEVRTARYEADEAPVIIGDPENITDVSSTAATITFSIKPDDECVTVKFTNKLTNYEKLSQSDCVINEFNGSKALRLNDMDGLTLDTAAADGSYSRVIQKSELFSALIRSDGTAVNIAAEDMSRLVISCTNEDINVKNDAGSVTITGRKEDVSGSIYKLTAVYDNTLTTEFELRFAAEPLVGKTEVAVIFRNDTENKSYYSDSSGQNGKYFNVYTLNVIRRSTDSGTVIDKILHNGTDTGKTDISAFPTPAVHPLFSDTDEFDSWSYSYTVNSETTSGICTTDELLGVIKAAPDGTEITVTAVLKDKTN